MATRWRCAMVVGFAFLSGGEQRLPRQGSVISRARLQPIVRMRATDWLLGERCECLLSIGMEWAGAGFFEAYDLT
jgi:hypothetical protein